ncbi:L-rhamnose mutarotase [Candidatus Latescibacterota bacterium]
MIRYGSLIKVRPEYEERYIILHKHAFPEVLKQIRKSNIRNYSIFLRDFPEGKMLFSFFEYVGKDFKADMDSMAADPVTKEWWKLTDPMQEPLESRKDGEWWATIEELFHMDGVRKSPEKVNRYASAVDLHPGFEEEYRKLHETVHPEVLEQFKKSNISNYSIFLHESRVYSYFEYTGEDFRKEMDSMTLNTETNKWLDTCKTFQKKIPNEKDFWVDMREVFHTD